MAIRKSNDVVGILGKLAKASKTLPMWGNSFVDEVRKSGVPIESLTVGELLQLVDRHQNRAVLPSVGLTGSSHANHAEADSSESSSLESLAPGYMARPGKADLHRRALAYAERKNVSYVEAVMVLEGGAR